jgi:hypothetical protein
LPLPVANGTPMLLPSLVFLRLQPLEEAIGTLLVESGLLLGVTSLGMLLPLQKAGITSRSCLFEWS